MALSMVASGSCGAEHYGRGAVDVGVEQADFLGLAWRGLGRDLPRLWFATRPLPLAWRHDFLPGGLLASGIVVVAGPGAFASSYLNLAEMGRSMLRPY